MNKLINSLMQLPRKVLIKLAILAVIILSTAALLTTHIVIKNLEDDIQNQEQQYIQESQAKDKLENYIEHADTDEGIKDVAKNELGMVDPDTTVYDFD